MNLAGVLEKVRVEQEKKSDVIIKLQSTIPLVEDNQAILKLGRNTTKRFTRTGLSSYLQKIDIPLGFFTKCSADLKREILREFHEVHNDQNVMLRLYGDNIRFCASDKYAKYDDINIAEALQGMGSDLEVREFSQTDNFMVIRALTKSPLKVQGLRPYYPGVQIMNSEVGKSAVKVQFCLWEEVCTNGMIVQNRSIGGFHMIHAGRDRAEKLRNGTQIVLGQLDTFVKESEEKLNNLAKESSEGFLATLEKNHTVPLKLLASMEDLLPKYSDASSLQDATATDAISTFTEAIQTYDWDARNSYERIAGEYLWSA